MSQEIKDLQEKIRDFGTVKIGLRDYEGLMSILSRWRKADEEIRDLWKTLTGPTPTNPVSVQPAAVQPEPLAALPAEEIPAKAPETAQDAPVARAYVAPPAPPPPVPEHVINRLAERFPVKTSKPAAPARAPAPAVPKEDPFAIGRDADRFAHFRDADARFPADVVAQLRAGAAPWKAWRLHRGLRAVELCKATGISSGNMSDLEGRYWRIGRAPTAARLVTLASGLGVTVADLTPDAILDHPMLDRAELDRREREFEQAERALASVARRGTLHLRQAQRHTVREEGRKPRVDIVGLHPRETQECKRTARDLPLHLRFMTFDEYQRATPSANLVVFQKGAPHAAFNVGQLKAKGVAVRFANGGVSSVLDVLRAVAATEAEQVAA